MSRAIEQLPLFGAAQAAEAAIAAEAKQAATRARRIDQAVDRVDRAMAVDAGVGQLPDTPTGEPARSPYPSSACPPKSATAIFLLVRSISLISPSQFIASRNP